MLATRRTRGSQGEKADKKREAELGKCLDSFRERVAYVVENAVPAARQLTDRLTAAMAEHGKLLVRTTD